MLHYDIFIKSDRNLDQIANLIREKLSISEKEKMPFGGFQKRYSDNYGGDYYLIEFLGLDIKLVSNTDDAFIEDMEQYNYYLMISLQHNFELEQNIFDSVMIFLTKILNYIGLEATNG